ncbi:DUF5979 domain-containing protein [Mycetocola reblochoni]|uniref:DUF5979 domain-containing protein n=1 Tax=Mycetocola reblochoni TaxID=331618 RepID=UPI003F9E7572
MSHSIAEVRAGAVDASVLAQVVGIDVLYSGIDVAETGGTIRAGEDNAAVLTVDTRLRVTTRDGGELLRGDVTVENTAFSELTNVIIADGGTIPFDDGTASLDLRTAKLVVGASKAFSVDGIAEADRADPFRVELGASSEAGGERETVSTERVTISDDDAAFWNLAMLADGDLTATVPAGADRIRVSALVDGAWVDGPWTAGTGEVTGLALPSGVEPGTVTGLRAEFSRADGGHFSDAVPPTVWEAALGFSAVLRDTALDGSAIPWGADGDAALSDEVDVRSERPSSDGFFEPAEDSADDSADLVRGVRGLQVLKSQPGTSHIGDVGDSAPWTLEFYNDGQVPLTVDTVVDRLPEFLQWDGIDPVVTTSGGTMGTDVSTSFDADDAELSLSWPEDARTLAPGEHVTISVGLILLPGLALDEWTTNSFVVDTAEALDRCSNGNGSGGNSEGTISGLPDDQCGTTNYQQPRPGGSIAVAKYVDGDVLGEYTDGEQNVVSDGGACVTDADGFTRYPCASNTAVGATDEWKLQIVNSGSDPYRTLTIVDPLPHVGDRMLAGGAARGSEFRPVIDTDFLPTVSGADGARIGLELTTSPDVCVGEGSGSAWRDDPRCETTAEWIALDDFTGNPGEITAIRATIDFTTTAEGQLGSGEAVDIHYRSVNVPATQAYPAGAPVEVPVDDSTLAWNQFGAVAEGITGNSYEKAPTRAGVVLASGALTVEKELTGEGAAGAPDLFQVQLTCTVTRGVGDERVPLSLPADGLLTLTAADGLTASVEGLPLGAECVVAEAGEPGSYGETERSEPQTVSILTPGGVADATRVTVTNDYRLGFFDIVKERVGDGVAQFGDGPFAAAYRCTLLGETVGVGEVLLDEGAGFRSRIDGLPIGAACEVEETEPGMAVATSYSPADATVLVTEDAEDPATVTITNTFATGSISVDKEAAAAQVAVGEDADYTITVRNTGQLDAEDVEVLDLLPDGAEFVSADNGGVHSGGSVRWVIDELPVGAEVVLAVTIRFSEPGTQRNQAVVTTPDGPWIPVAPTDPDDSGVESTDVDVTPALPTTGAAISGIVIAAAAVLIIAGLALVLIRRRRGPSGPAGGLGGDPDDGGTGEPGPADGGPDGSGSGPDGDPGSGR